MIEYEILLAIDLGKTLPSVGSMMDRINHDLSMFGFHEQIGVRADVMCAHLQVSQPLTNEQEETVKTALASALNERLPNYGFTITAIRCKPSQSGNQPQST